MTPTDPTKLSRGLLAAYAAPAFAQTLLVGPASIILQGIYAKYFGLSLAAIALVLLIARTFDNLIDPLIGYASDRYRARFGSRKPWLIAGSLIAVVACWFLYVPAQPVTAGYLLVWLLVAAIGWSVTEIPYTGWMVEISQDYGERTRLAAWRAVGLYLGSIAFYGIPFLPWLTTTEFTPDTLRWSFILAAIALPATTLIAVARVPNGPAPPPQVRESWRNMMRAIFRNKPLLIFTLMFALSGFGSGIHFGVLFFYFDGYLHLGKEFAGVVLLALPVGLLAVPVWTFLCGRFGKQKAWAAGSAAGALALGLFGLISPGEYGVLGPAVVLILVLGLLAVSTVAPPAMLADVVDYGRLRFGVDYAGTYFAFYSLTQKLVTGLGAAIALAVASVFGFDPQLSEQTATGRFGLIFTFAGLPAVFLLASVPLIWWFPINQRRQRTIARRLDERQWRLSARNGMAANAARTF